MYNYRRYYSKICSFEAPGRSKSWRSEREGVRLAEGNI